ncbi:myocyte enhancer factor 2D, partial [Conidiobolus coronatus NRRL 28638]
MGRKKIQIQYIPDTRGRQVTFNKRKAGLLKKCGELSVLTGSHAVIIIFDERDDLHLFGSSDPRILVQKYMN